MRRHVLCGRYGAADTAAVLVSPDETGSEFDLISPQKKLLHGMGGALDDLMKIGVHPTSIGVDLLVLAAHVQAADTRLSRRSESQDSWTREIRIVVPVSDPVLWEGVASMLKRALDFLTGDLWSVAFRPKPDGLPAIPSAGLVEPDFDGVSLFSGGLDSLIGAIDALKSNRTPLLVSHAGDGAASAAQAACFEGLRAHYPKNQFHRLRLWMDMQGVQVVDSDHEMTMRGRSFLFFAAGVFAGTGLNKPFTLNVPENGFIALNVPLDPLRLGSHSTRTTHPFYIARWHEMLAHLGIPCQIENPYWDRTKGEMVLACADTALLQDLIPASLSCSSPTKGRWQHLPIQHCGFCVPCLIRRGAILKGLGPGADRTVYSIEDLAERVLDSAEAEGRQIRSFEFAIDRLRRRSNLASILIHSNGSLLDESASRQSALADVYRRGMAEVEQLLKGVRTQAG
jgi:hypothetical protein